MPVAQAARHRSHAERLSLLAAHKFLVLFVFLLISLVLYPYVENSRSAYLVFRVVSAAGILFAVYAINLRRTVLICAALLAIPAVLQHVLQFQPTAGTLSVVNIVLSFIFDVFVVVVVFQRVIMESQPTSETIFGALCIYLFVGFIFASVYGMMATLQPKAFYLDPLVNTHSIPDRFDFIYYSFATITSLGATGITPVSPPVRSITVIETMVGMFYLAVLIARLVTTYKHPSFSERD